MLVLRMVVGVADDVGMIECNHGTTQLLKTKPYCRTQHQQHEGEHPDGECEGSLRSVPLFRQAKVLSLELCIPSGGLIFEELL